MTVTCWPILGTIECQQRHLIIQSKTFCKQNILRKIPYKLWYYRIDLSNICEVRFCLYFFFSANHINNLIFLGNDFCFNGSHCLFSFIMDPIVLTHFTTYGFGHEPFIRRANDNYLFRNVSIDHLDLMNN